MFTHPLMISENALYWPLAILLFFDANTMWLFSLHSAVQHSLKFLILLLPLVVRGLRGNLVLGSSHFILKFLLLIAALSALFPMSLRAGYAEYYLVIFFCYFLLVILNIATLRKGGIVDLFYKFETFTVVFAVISLFFWLFGETIKLIPPMGYAHNAWSGTVPNFYFLHYGAQVYRNCGVFVEAPMYNLVLCTSLFVELFLREKLSKLRFSILCITILTTFSTTGQLVMMGALFVRFVVLSKKKFSLLVIVISSILAMIAMAAVVYAAVVIMVEKAEGASYAVRYMKMMTELNAFKTSPIIGNGFFSYTYGTSNSICLILAEGGIWQFLLYVLPMVFMPLWLSKKLAQPSLKYFSLFYFAVFSITVSPYLLLTYTVIASCLCRVILDKNTFLDKWTVRDKN